jgi:hypothetical protein
MQIRLETNTNHVDMIESLKLNVSLETEMFFSLVKFSVIL